MAKKIAPNIAEVVLDRRAALESRQLRAASALQANLEAVRKELNRKLRQLRVFTDPKTGALVKNSAAELSIRNLRNDVTTVLRREAKAATEKLIAQRGRAFEMSAMDAKFAIEEATGGLVQSTTQFSQIFEEAADISARAPVLGIVPKNALVGVTKDLERRYQNALTQGFIKGESISKIASRLDAATNIGKRAATRIARTNLNASINEANRMIYDADPEIFSGYRWDATFDARTTAICASLHGTFYPLGSIPPGPPAHPNCRSELIPVFKDPEVEAFANDGGRRVRKFDKFGQADGREIIKSDADFEKWLRKQPKSVIRRVAGGRIAGDLLASGKINLQDIVGDDLQPRKLKSIVQRALARRPKDKALQRLADKLGVRPATKATLRKKDIAVQRKVRHTIGTRDDQSAKEKERIEKIDEAKTLRTRDIVRGKAKALIDQDILSSPPETLAARLVDEVGPLDTKIAGLEREIREARDQQAKLFKRQGRGAVTTARMRKIESQAQKDIALLKKTRGTKDAKIAKLLNIKDHAKFDIEVFGPNIRAEKKVEKILRKMEKFVTGKGKKIKVSVSIVGKNNRAFVSPGSRRMTLGLGSGRDDVFHETGHLIELTRPKVKRAAAKFLASRTKGERAELLSKLFNDPGYNFTEVAKKDKFFNAYVGKIYPKKFGTEIVSMGIEEMFRSPVKFARRDPEFFEFILNVLRGNI